MQAYLLAIDVDRRIAARCTGRRGYRRSTVLAVATACQDPAEGGESIKIVKTLLLAVAASISLVALLLSLSGAHVGHEQPMDLSGATQFADDEIAAGPASNGARQDEAIARLKNCNVSAVILQALQSLGSGAGPICAADGSPGNVSPRDR